MVRIVVNESLKFLKRNRQLESLDDGWDVPDTVEDEPDAEDIPSEVLQEMICRLPAGYRAVFNLYVFEKKSHKEIAAMLNIKESTSASQLHRAKAVLVKEVQRYKAQVNGR
jgi:RNA polymerase sigma factor, sigma-70 family